MLRCGPYSRNLLNLRGIRLLSSKRRYKDAIYDQFARIGNAMGSSKCLELQELF